MRIGIDLLWVRVGICGGTESVVRNLLDGFTQYAPQHEYVLFVARDNAESFCHYTEYPCVKIHVSYRLCKSGKKNPVGEPAPRQYCCRCTGGCHADPRVQQACVTQ